MADFKQAWSKTSKIEGGYVNNSSDAGRETYRGIARHFWPKWDGWNIIDFAKLKLGFTDTTDASDVTKKTIDAELEKNEHLTALVESFYKMNFWDVFSLDDQESQRIADKVFDIAVNMGVARAKEFYDSSLKA